MNNNKIVHVAKPMQLDSNGNTINNSDVKVLPKKDKLNKEKKKININISSDTMKHIVIILILIAILVGFLGLYVVPRIVNQEQVIDDLKEVEDNYNIVELNSVSISDYEYVSDGTYNLNDNFKLVISNSNISVNNKLIDGSNVLSNSIGVSDDVLVIGVMIDNNIHLLGLNTNGDIIYEISNIPGLDDMKLTDININNGVIRVSATRLNNNMLNNINICNSDDLTNNNLDDSYMIGGSYYIYYIGNNKFHDPIISNRDTIGMYREYNCDIENN